MYIKKIGLFALTGIIAIFLVAGCANPKEDSPASQAVYVEVTTVEAINVDDISDLSGTLEPIEDATVSFEASGSISSLAVQKGSKVEEGDILASIKSENYDFQTLQTKAQLQSAETAYNQALISAQRCESLYKEGAISKIDYENAVNGMQQAKAAYNQAYAAQQQVELAASKTSLTSPIKGVVLSEYINKGQLVSAGTPAYRIGNIDKLKVNILVPDSEILFWEISDKTIMKLYDESFEGIVTNISPTTDENTGSISVEVTVDNAQHKLFAGQVVICRHNSNSGAAIYIPKESVINNGSSSAYVFLLKNNRAVKTEVTIGTLKNNLFEIKAGLKENEIIIVKGADRLSDGEKVKVIGSDE